MTTEIKIRGVAWYPERELWRAYLHIGARQVYHSYHKTLPDAIEARLAAEVRFGHDREASVAYARSCPRGHSGRRKIKEADPYARFLRPVVGQGWEAFREVQRGPKGMRVLTEKTLGVWPDYQTARMVLVADDMGEKAPIALLRRYLRAHAQAEEIHARLAGMGEKIIEALYRYGYSGPTRCRSERWLLGHAWQRVRRTKRVTGLDGAGKPVSQRVPGGEFLRIRKIIREGT